MVLTSQHHHSPDSTKLSRNTAFRRLRTFRVDHLTNRFSTPPRMVFTFTTNHGTQEHITHVSTNCAVRRSRVTVGSILRPVVYTEQIHRPSNISPDAERLLAEYQPMLFGGVCDRDELAEKSGKLLRGIAAISDEVAVSRAGLADGRRVPLHQRHCPTRSGPASVPSLCGAIYAVAHIYL